MATLTMSMAPWISGGGGIATLRPSAPMTLLSGSSVRTTGISLRSSTSRPALLSCSFIPISSSLSSSFAGWISQEEESLQIARAQVTNVAVYMTNQGYNP